MDMFDRNKRNLKSRPGLHRYDIDGHGGKIQRMVYHSSCHSANIAYKLVFNVELCITGN
jgi:hypothetical protein